MVAWLRNGRALDLGSTGRGFKSYSGQSYVTTLGKLFTPMCPLADAIQGGNPAMPPIMVLGGLAPPSQAAAGSVKGRWIMEISIFSLVSLTII